MLHNIRLRYLVGVVFGVVALSFTGCSKDDYNSVPSTNGNGDTTEPKVDGRVVTAYCTWYGSTLPDPQYVTNINYAFAEVYVAGGVYKGFKLEGQESRFQNVVNLKKLNPSLKIMISFTHVVENSDNSQGGSFSAIAANADYRKQFAEDCLAFIKKWGIDGVDMDWEFPGLSWSGAACDPANDVANFTLLMRQLRETLGNNYLLTFAGYVMDKHPTTGGYEYIDIAAVMPYVDYVNIMTYDMDAAPKYQSALSDPSSYWDCQRAVNAYISAGAPLSKLLLGIPFYGRHAFSDKTINYKDIINLDKNVYKIDNWDTAANVPYVTKNGQMYYSYDNAKSIAIKGAWIIGLGMKGMCYWDCSGDDGEETLTKAVWNATMKH